MVPFFHSALQKDLRSHKDLNADYEDKIAALEEEVRKINELFSDTQQELDQKCEELQETQANYQATRQQLRQTGRSLKETTIDRDEKQCLVDEVCHLFSVLITILTLFPLGTKI